MPGSCGEGSTDGQRAGVSAMSKAVPWSLQLMPEHHAQCKSEFQCPFALLPRGQLGRERAAAAEIAAGRAPAGMWTTAHTNSSRNRLEPRAHLLHFRRLLRPPSQKGVGQRGRRVGGPRAIAGTAGVGTRDQVTQARHGELGLRSARTQKSIPNNDYDVETTLCISNVLHALGNGVRVMCHD